MDAASKAGTRCASIPAIIPDSTSPAPAVASHGGALSAIEARPSGDATTVSAPLISTTACDSCAARRARSSFESAWTLFARDENNRANSPSCGVSTACVPGCAAMASNNVCGMSAKLVSASASRTTARGPDRAVSALSRVRRHRQRIARRSHRDESRACAQRRARCETRGTGFRHAARHHHRMAASIFVTSDAWYRKMSVPPRRYILKSLRMDDIQHARRNADVGHLHLAAMNAAGQQKMTGLLAKERHRAGGVDRNAHYFAAVAVDAARQIDRQHRSTACVDRLDHRARLAFHVTIESCAEQRIDDERGFAERLRLEREKRAAPCFRGTCCVAFQRIWFAQQGDGDVAATRGEIAGGDEAVAAIVATPRHHYDVPIRGEPLRRGGHRLPRTLHQHEAVSAALHRKRIGAGHFSDAQKFHESSPLDTARLSCTAAQSCGRSPALKMYICIF